MSTSDLFVKVNGHIHEWEQLHNNREVKTCPNMAKLQ